MRVAVISLGHHGCESGRGRGRGRVSETDSVILLPKSTMVELMVELKTQSIMYSSLVDFLTK